MKLDMAVIGILPKEGPVRSKVCELANTIEETLFQQTKSRISAIVSPEYSGKNWESFLNDREYELYCCALKAHTPATSGRTDMVTVDSESRSVVGELICCRADLILIVWNEDIREMDSAVWEILQRAQHTHTPCVWVSSKPSSEGNVYWAANSSFEPFRPELLDELYKTLSAEKIEPISPEKKLRPLLSIGMKLQRRFLHRHNAQSVEVPANYDVLLRDDHSETNLGTESIRRVLLESYKAYDRSAVHNSSMYQAVMYWRAILPLITTLFLAIGLYADSILRLLPFKIFSNAQALDILMGIGFMIYAALNLYVYQLSKSSCVQNWHRQFLNSRYVAEMLRLLIHFTPFGIFLNLDKISGGDKNICATVRNILDEIGGGDISVDKSNVHRILEHAIEMVKDQISYHRFSAERYKNIVIRLKKWYSAIFKVGFVLVILRSMMQFAVVLDGDFYKIPFADENISSAMTYASILTLIIPAWASYFSSKLEQCSYEYNYINHCQMAENLNEELERLEFARELDNAVLLESLGSISERLSEVMLVNDTNLWHSKLKNSKVTHL